MRDSHRTGNHAAQNTRLRLLGYGRNIAPYPESENLLTEIGDLFGVTDEVTRGHSADFGISNI